jgi:hypothetical protein
MICKVCQRELGTGHSVAELRICVDRAIKAKSVADVMEYYSKERALLESVLGMEE